MNKNILYSLMVLFLFVSCTKTDVGAQIPNDPNQDGHDQVEQVDLKGLLAETDWKGTEISSGVVWKHYHFSDIFESRQYINIFEVDLSKKWKIEIPYVRSGFMKTSEAAVANNALVAFNGSYFSTSRGGSTVFFKYDGQIINQTVNGFDWFRQNGAVVLDNTGKPHIAARSTLDWPALTEPTVLAGGPLLILDGEQLSQADVDFNQVRHPRTAVGITADNKMIAVVVDGRSLDSQGLTIPELSELMAALGCVQALNLDGGGSSTAWVKGGGVVNFPSDNGLFDHEGERGVATVFTVKAN